MKLQSSVGTFSEDDISQRMGSFRGCLHGIEGALLCNLLDLAFAQAEAKESANLTNALTQVL